MPLRPTPRTRRLLPAAALATGLAIAALVAAGPAAAQGGDFLRLADRNGDGAISVAEARIALTAQYDLMDRNNDGVVSRQEFLAARLARISQFDLNGDGKITRFEVRRHFLARMRR